MENIKKIAKIVFVLIITFIIMRILGIDFKTAIEMILISFGVMVGIFAYIIFLTFLCLKISKKKNLLEQEKQDKENRNEKKRFLEKLKPAKIKSNLVIVDEKMDDVCYRPTYQLTCCHKNNFKISIHGEVEKSIFGGVTFISKDDGFAISSECLECQKQYELFNNTKDGYDGYLCTEGPIDFASENFKCLKCGENDFYIEITYAYDIDKDMIKEIKQTMKENNKEDITNTFGWITMTIKCNKCGREYQKIVDYECM